MRSLPHFLSYLLRVTVFLSLAGMLTLWQNCSEVGFTTDNVAFSSKTDAERTPEDLPDKDDIIKDDEIRMPDIPSDPDGTVDEPDRDFLTTNCGTRGGEIAAPFEISDGAADRNVTGHRGPLVIDEARTLTINGAYGPAMIGAADTSPLITHVRGPLSFRANIVTELSDIRGPTKAQTLEMDAAFNLRGPLHLETSLLGELSDQRGPVCLSASEAGALFNLRGPLRIMGASSSTQKALIQSINDTRGPIQVVDADVGEIVNHRGPIILINANLGRLENHRGPVILIEGSEVAEVIDHKGPIVEK